MFFSIMPVWYYRIQLLAACLARIQAPLRFKEALEMFVEMKGAQGKALTLLVIGLYPTMV